MTTLPNDMLENASAAGEVGWKIADFSLVLEKAKQNDLACLGGQFQFQFDDGICELYWLNADSNGRESDEPWDQFRLRSIDEVARNFSNLCRITNFEKEIERWEFVREKRDSGIEPMEYLWFVAYFVTEAEHDELGCSGSR